MPNLIAKPFDKADETRTPDKTNVQVVDLGGGVKAARLTLEPGWRWSDCIKPVAGTDSCQALHIGTVESGKLQVRHDDGSELEVGPGAAYRIEPGHDAWVIGDDPFVSYEFESTTAATYASPRS
jgi:hypothetical protein